MPEGPEIHRAAHRLRKALEGKVITHVECPYATIRGQEHRFLEQEVLQVKARSKAMLMYVGDDVLYSHNQLYGPVSYTHLRAHETREDRVWRRVR